MIIGPAAKVGYVLVTPSLASNTPVMLLTNEAMALQTFPTTSNVQALVPFMTAVTCNGPYAASSFAASAGGGANVAGRIVSAGASVTYFGSVINMGGTYTRFISPNHDNLAALPMDSYAKYDEASITRIDGDPEWLLACGIDDTELIYQSSPETDATGSATYINAIYPYSGSQNISSTTPTPYFSYGTFPALTSATTLTLTRTTTVGTLPATGSLYALVSGTFYTIAYTAVGDQSGASVAFTIASTTIPAGTAYVGYPYHPSYVGVLAGATNPLSVGGAPMACLITPAITTTSNVFEVEYIQHVEYIGPTTSALHTPTHSDSAGFERVSTVGNRLPAAIAAEPNAHPSTLARQLLGTVMAEAAPMVANAVGRGLGGLGGAAVSAIAQAGANYLMPAQSMAMVPYRPPR